MPSGVYIRTEWHRKRTREFSGNSMKGKKHKLETIEKMKKAKLKAHQDGKYTEETRDKIRKARSKQVFSKESQIKKSKTLKRRWKDRSNNKFGSCERSEKIKKALTLSSEIRICKCSCNKQFKCKINSKQKYITGHNPSYMKDKKWEDVFSLDIVTELKRLHRDKAIKMHSENKFPQTDTLPHRLLRRAMKENDLWNGFQDEVSFKWGSIDIANSQKKIAIYVDGNYWHNYPNGTRIDKSHNTYLKNNDWKVLRFWESDIKKDINSCLDTIGRII